MHLTQYRMVASMSGWRVNGERLQMGIISNSDQGQGYGEGMF